MKQQTKHHTITTGPAAVKGVENYIRSKVHEPTQTGIDMVIRAYGDSKLGDGRSKQEICDFIQKGFGQFIQWFKEHFKNALK